MVSIMGFDNECILSIQSLPGEYFCPVCRLLVYPNEALQSQCTHLYCKPCLAYIANSSRACPYDGYLVTEADSKPLIESNQALAETINKIAVHCLYHRSGCTWQGPLSECIYHCSGCAFGNSPVVCNRCGIQIIHRQVQEHAQSCPGVQPQAVPPHEATAASAGATNPSQISKPAEPASSQAQISQAVNVVAAPTPEQWYQQQYHQYNQQHAGYDAYNQQYQQYYPHQQPQEAVQPQHYQQPQPQVQGPLPPQSQLHGPASSPLKQQSSNVQQPAPPSQPQALAQPHGQPQVPPQTQVQSQVTAVPVVPPPPPPNQQQQPRPAIIPYPQLNMQNNPAQPLQFNPSHLLQYPQLPTQNPVLQHPQSSVLHPPPHPRPLPHSQVQPHSQAQPHGPVPHPQGPHHVHQSQPNPPANVLIQPQVQSTHTVAGFQSYPPPQPPCQLQLGGPQQHTVPIGPSQLSQQPVQVHGQGQFPQPSLAVRPPQAQATILNQLNPGSLPPPPRSTNFLSAQQPFHPHSQPPGQLVSPHNVMQPIQQHLSQPHAQQKQPSLGGQQLGFTQNQLYQQASFAQQQMPMHPQMRPLGPTPSNPPQPQQNVAVLHSLQHPHLSQNVVGRPPVPNHGVPLQVSPRAPGVVQVRPPQPGSNPNNLVVPNSRVQPSLQEHHGSVFYSPMLERSVTNNQAGLSSQRTTKVDEKSLGGNVNEIKTLKTETDSNHPPVEQKASENQGAPKKMTKEESAQNEQPSDAKSGRVLLKDHKDFPTNGPELDKSVTHGGKENQAGPLLGTSVQHNELTEERVQTDTSSVMEPSANERVPSAAHGVDGSRGVPSPGQKSARGVARLPSQQRVAAPSGLPAAPPGPPLKSRSPGQPLDQFGPPGFGLQPRQLNPPEKVLPPFSKQPFDPTISSGCMPCHDSLPPLGRGQRQFQHQFAPLHVPHNQGHLHQRMPMGEPLEGIPPGASDRLGGMSISQKHAPNAMEAETFPVRRPFYMDSRQPDRSLPVSMERGPWGPPARMDRPPGVELSLFYDQEERFKSFPYEHMHASSVNSSRHVYERRWFEEESKSLRDPIAKYGNHFPLGGRFDGDPFEKAVHGLISDNAGSTSSRMLPRDRDVVLGKRRFDPPEDNAERLDSYHRRADMLGSLPGYTRSSMEASAIRSPGREHGGISSRGLGGLPSISHSSLGSDDIVRRESHLYRDPIGRSFPESRFQGLPRHFHKSEFERPGNLGSREHLRNGDLIGRDFPSHMPRHELLGIRNLRMGDPGGFDSFRDHAPAGDIVGPEIYRGQPGFRSTLSLKGFSAGKESFDDLRSRRVTNMGWCRICNVDCESVEGLDLHSQTTEHQKVAMDIVRSIKQQNAKKQKV
ncbi:trithorax group protein osa-like isoform X2 [Punica granatum]|nr:trithorax group protein osa-like isoform X2 [Punica granatum]